MHIIILADPIDNQRAGVYVYTKNISEQFLKNHKTHKYTFIHERKNPFFKNTNNYIVPKRKIPGYSTYRKFFLIPKLIKHIKPDIVFEPCHIGPFNIPKNIKRVVMIHDLTPILFPKFHIKRSTIIHHLLLKRVLKNSDLILTASKTTKRDIQKYCKTKAKIEIVPLGINSFLTKSKNKDSVVPGDNSEYKTEISQIALNPSPYILYLGTIEPRKNLETLVDAYSELKKEYKIRHKLILAGEIGWKSGSIIKKCIKNKIILTGYLTEKEKAAYYKNADIFIYPSLYEGFGLPPLEAMSYGIPVIASNGGSLKEILNSHALLFSPKDKTQLKKHILKLIKNKNLREKLGKKGLTYSKNFTWKKTATKTLETIQRCFRKN